MSGCDWATIEAFTSLREFRNLLARLEADVREGRASQVPVAPAKGWGTAFKERWFKCGDSPDIWRLVAPDPPFPGVFDRI